MGAVGKLLAFVLWAGILPFGTGLFVSSFEAPSERKLHIIIAQGYLASFALFECLGLVVLFTTALGNFALLVGLYGISVAALSVIGIVRVRKTGGLAPSPVFHVFDVLKKKEKWRPDPQALVFWLLFAALLAFELYMSYTHASYDGDDAYYVAQSVQTWQTGTMYHYVPYTGITTELDGRHAMAMIPMWISAIATLCGTHPTIVTHSLIPIVFLPLADIAAFCLIHALLHDKDSKKRTERMIPAFMSALALIQIFGNVSIYTPETFLLMRTWQGKTVFANIIVPLGFYTLLLAAHRIGEGGSMRLPMILMLLVNVASGFCTAMAPMFAAFLFLAGSVFVSLAYRDREYWKKTILCCLPNVVYAAILVRVMLPNLLSGGGL
ncbi:MAG: DUF6077 domain-containing protein [Lachnospiraceae bacterium]